jgi:hypothetical protein
MTGNNNDLWGSVPESDPALVAWQLSALIDWFELREVLVREPLKNLGMLA